MDKLFLKWAAFQGGGHAEPSCGTSRRHGVLNDVGLKGPLLEVGFRIGSGWLGRLAVRLSGDEVPA